MLSLAGNIGMSIVNSSLSIAEISQKLGFEPTTVIVKGQLISRTLQLKSQYNQWRLEVPIETTVNDAMRKLLEPVAGAKTQLDKIRAESEEIKISLFIRSNNGQMGFDLTHDVISLLSELKMELDVHILSFGEVEEAHN